MRAADKQPPALAPSRRTFLPVKTKMGVSKKKLMRDFKARNVSREGREPPGKH
jgi:hypothetical protein